jgi:hypothetical protein
MLSFLRRKSRPELTFNSRVSAFWKWFEDVAPRFYSTIEAGKCSSLADETSAKVDELLPGLAWVYGPGADGKGHSLTLSGEGNEHRQLLALHWHARAPIIAGWTFYPSRQAGPIKGHVIEMDEGRFDPKEIWVTPQVDKEREKIDLMIWHPLWEKIGEKQRGTVVFLFLDEALGEYGTEWWIGEIQFGQDRLADSFPLEELAGYVAKISQKNGWKKYPPGGSWTLFNVKVEDKVYPRSDIRTQATAVPSLLHAYMDAAGNLDDPLSSTGAEYVYVSIDRSFFPQGSEVQVRGEIEEALDNAVKAAGSGRLIGGALGTQRGYIDLLIYDGSASLAVIRETLRSLKLPRGTMIEFFACEKLGRRVAI